MQPPQLLSPMDRLTLVHDCFMRTSIYVATNPSNEDVQTLVPVVRQLHELQELMRGELGVTIGQVIGGTA